MNTYRKIANGHHEEESRFSSRDFGGRKSRHISDLKRSRNRLAKHREERDALKEQEEEIQNARP